MVRQFVVGLIAAAALVPAVVKAEAGLSNIVQGSTSKEVMALVGEPRERLERETRRELVWIYPTGSVVFVGGRARSVYLNGSSQDRFSEEYKRTVELAKAATPAPPSSPVEDILTEILKEVPSEQGAGAEAGGDLKPVEISH